MWHNHQLHMLKNCYSGIVCAVAIISLGTLSCSCRNVPCSAPEKMSSVSGLFVCGYGFRENDQGFFSTLKRGCSSDKTRCVWLHECVLKAEFKKREVTNLEPNYFVLFLDAKDNIVTALECNGDNFRFVESKRTFWSYYVGRIISKNDDPRQWGEIPSFEKIVKNLCATQTFSRRN